MTYSVFTFNGETQILKLHLSILENYVDKFIIVEANKTFTGHDKPLHFFRVQRYFEKWWPKIEYFVVNDWDDTDLWEQAVKSPNTKGASHWKREFYVKESIHKALKYANVQDNDTLLIGDVDEIIDPTAHFTSDGPVKAKLRVYTYWLNNRSTEPFWGTLIAQYKDIKNECLNHMRSDKSLYSKGLYLGWHFTSMGGLDDIRKKLDDSYSAETYNTPEVQSLLENNVAQNKDFLGRDFTFAMDESEWPAFLKENKKQFIRLCM